MKPSEFSRNFSLYGALIQNWNQVGADVVAQVELAGYNQPSFDPKTDAEIRPVVLIFRSAEPQGTETREFCVPVNGDAKVIDQEEITSEQQGLGTLEITCEVERYATSDDPGAIDYVTLRLRFAAVEIIDARGV